MAPKRRIDPRSLYVSRDNIEPSIGQNTDSPSENHNVVVSNTNMHASTSHAHVDPLYDATTTAYFSSDESAHEDHAIDEEAENPCADEMGTSNSTDTRRIKKGRGETTCKHIHLMPPDKVIKMQRNEYGQFVGDGQVQLSSFMGTLIRTGSLFPMTPLSWKHVSNFSKSTAWNLIKQRFDVYETDRKHIMHLLGERYKDNKAKFKSLFYRPSDSPEAVIARGGPQSMPVSQFVDMVTFWYSIKGKNISEKNKACRSNQMGAHALGRTSLANRKNELTVELGKEPTRLELYINSRTSRKKENTMVDDYAKSKKAALEKAIDEQMSQCPNDTPIGEIHEAVFRSTFGPEYYGRCRGMGSGVTAIQVFPDLSRRSKMSGMGPTSSKEMREIDQLKLQMMNMQKTIDCLVTAISQQGSREDCSGTSADQLARMMNSRSNQSADSTPEDMPPMEPNTRIHHEHGGQREN